MTSLGLNFFYSSSKCTAIGLCLFIYRSNFMINSVLKLNFDCKNQLELLHFKFHWISLYFFRCSTESRKCEELQWQIDAATDWTGTIGGNAASMDGHRSTCAGTSIWVERSMQMWSRIECKVEKDQQPSHIQPKMILALSWQIQRTNCF